MFKESMRQNLETMIYEHRRSLKGTHPDKDPHCSCPFDQCCRVCAKIFPEWDKWIIENGLDPTEDGNHPCDFYSREEIERRIKEVILR